jgi:hypothetical protein
VRVFKYQPVGTDAESYLVHEGSNLSAEEAREVRKTLRRIPDDLTSRLLLFGRGNRGRSGSDTAHLNWLIENHPRHRVHETITLNKKDDVYKNARSLWLKHVRANPDDVTILVHAAAFFTGTSLEDAPYAVKFLSRASDLDAFNDDIPRQLSFVYSLMCRNSSPSKNAKLAHNSVEQLKIAIERYALPNAKGDSYLLPYFSMFVSNIAQVAIDANSIEDAKDLGRILMNHRSINKRRWRILGGESSDGVYILSTYRGHTILGKAALASGQIDAAKKHLISMMKLPVYRDADFELAQRLLLMGESKLVIQYLEQCRRGFEKSIHKEYSVEMTRFIDDWLKKIHGGKQDKIIIIMRP